MNKPLQLEELLDDLRNGPPDRATLTCQRDAYALVYTDDAAYEKEDCIRLTASECQLLFGNEHTAAQLLDALGNLPDAALLIHGLDMSSETMDVLERGFAAVDEA